MAPCQYGSFETTLSLVAFAFQFKTHDHDGSTTEWKSKSKSVLKCAQWNPKTHQKRENFNVEVHCLFDISVSHPKLSYLEQ